MSIQILEKAIRLYDGQAGVGREIGVSRQYVNEMLKTGVIPDARLKQLKALVKKAIRELQAEDYA